MKLYLKPKRLYYLILIVIGIAGLASAYFDRNSNPLFVALFAIIFLAANSTMPSQNIRKHFLVQFGLTSLVMIFGIGIFNYVVNPFSIYPTDFFDPILLTSRNLKMGIYATSPTPDIVILGNSRSFTVDTIQIMKLWHKSALNLSVASGTTQDDLALLRFMMERGKMPNLLIINLSPERFVTLDLRLIEPNSQLLKYQDNINQVDSLQKSIDWWGEIFSREQTEASMRVIQAELWGGRPAPSTIFDNTGVARNQTRQPITDDFSMETLDKIGWGRLFTETLTPNMEVMGMKRFRQILDLAKAQNMLVIGYAPPVHPLFKTLLESNSDFERVRKHINDQINALTKSYSFYFSDFMDDERLADDPTMYQDNRHPTLEASALMMQQLYDQYQTYVKSS